MARYPLTLERQEQALIKVRGLDPRNLGLDVKLEVDAIVQYKKPWQPPNLTIRGPSMGNTFTADPLRRSVKPLGASVVGIRGPLLGLQVRTPLRVIHALTEGPTLPGGSYNALDAAISPTCRSTT